MSAEKMEEDAKKEQILALAKIIDSHGNQWWRFPEEKEKFIKGFLGTASIFFVGDQPSTGDWGKNDPNRKLFYSMVSTYHMQNAHLTDIYKRRGKSSSLWKKIPEDFPEHIMLFTEEVRILQPTKIVAMGNLAFYLIEHYLPDLRPITWQIYHFAHITKTKKFIDYHNDFKRVLDTFNWGSK